MGFRGRGNAGRGPRIEGLDFLRKSQLSLPQCGGTKSAINDSYGCDYYKNKYQVWDLFYVRGFVVLRPILRPRRSKKAILGWLARRGGKNAPTVV
jgi:hypothetical protein